MYFREILNQYGDQVYDYLNQMSKISIIILDDSLIIVDCNDIFFRELGLREKPIGEDFNKLLKTEILKEELPSVGECKQIKFSIVLHGDLLTIIDCCIYNTDKGYILFGKKFSKLNKNIVLKMAEVNNELADLARELTKRTVELEKKNIIIKNLVNLDALTGVYNRRYMEEALPKQINKARQKNEALSIIMADLDHFKSINDTYGHDMGDDVLKEFSSIIKRLCRSKDIIFRFGGEEFLIALPNTNKENAVTIAESMRATLKSFKFQNIERLITASFGVAELTEENDIIELIKRADKALYKAKNKGRNRIELA